MPVFRWTTQCSRKRRSRWRDLRIAILREYMVKPTKNHETISDQIDREIKTVLRDRLGAELVETITPAYPDDSDVPNLTYTFADALSELLPRMMPEIFTRRDGSGTLLFAVPGHDVTSYDYLRKLSQRQAPLTDRINLTNIVSYGAEPCYPRAMEPWRCNDVMFDIDRYLEDRGDARIRSWADWVANARFRDDASRAGAENWLALKNHHAPGKGDQVARSYIARLALQRVMSENRIDAFVHPENTVPTPKIQGPNVGQISLEGITPFLQIPRVVVPGRHDGHRLRATVRVERDEDGLHVGTGAEHAEEQTAAPDAHRDHVLRRAGRGADADQDWHRLRGGDAPSHAAAGVWSGVVARRHDRAPALTVRQPSGWPDFPVRPVTDVWRAGVRDQRAATMKVGTCLCTR